MGWFSLLFRIVVLLLRNRAMTGYNEYMYKQRGSNHRRNERGNRRQDRGRNHTSWQGVSKWYNKSVGDKGHYYHQHVVIPGALKLLNLTKTASLLDIACGQGVLARHADVGQYYGVDIAADLIAEARSRARSNQQFFVGDVTSPLPFPKKDFSHAAIVLALQNIEHADLVIKNASDHLVTGGKFLIVLNHPAFRIPRQSSWGIDEQNKLQYRKIVRYMSPLKIPIDMTPGHSQKHALTWSYHHPISYYTTLLYTHGFMIQNIEEWISDKTSEGKAAAMENRSREEFPMFMAILAVKS